MEPSTLNETSTDQSVGIHSVTSSENYSNCLDQLTKNGMLALMELIKASNNLPIEQWEFYKTFPSFNGLVGPESQKILELLNNMLHHQQVRGNIVRRDNEEKFELIIEANDAILESVDCDLDELQGLKKNPEPVVSNIRTVDRRGKFSLKNRFNVSHSTNLQSSTVHSLVTSRLNVRPQIKFKDKIDNRNIPFEPRIKEKPNALKPLSILVEKYDDRGESFSHPYEYELDMFKPSEDQLKMCNPQKPKSLDEVSLIFVKDVETLNSMMDHLKKQTEIAVDVEHHSYRSFQGFTCLVQISTRDMDFVIDALELRHELFVLNEVFTDSKIVKVLHGAEHDIEWLQRDLCVYIVNMFDTHQAAKLLDFPRLNLAYLLKVFCNIDTNKQFQLYDWRTRPLIQEAMRYAREDTHYLLYVYDQLKNILIEKCQHKTNLLESVINRSTEICKRKYWKDILTEDSHIEFYRRSKKMFDNKQMYALKYLYQWRDKIAREEDESIMYVLPNHMLLNIAESLPREVQGISALCNPVPPLVKQYEREIHKIIFKAREQSLVKPVVEGKALNQSLSQVQPNWVPVNVDSKLYCPHDLSHCDDDVREDLPTLLEKKLIFPSTGVKNNKFISDAAVIDIIHENFEGDDSILNASLLKGKERQWRFVSPYQRYQKIMAFVHSEERKAPTNSVTSGEEPSPAKIPKLVSEGPKDVASNEERITVKNLLNDCDKPTTLLGKEVLEDRNKNLGSSETNVNSEVMPFSESSDSKKKKHKKKGKKRVATETRLNISVDEKEKESQQNNPNYNCAKTDIIVEQNETIPAALRQPENTESKFRMNFNLETPVENNVNDQKNPSSVPENKTKRKVKEDNVTDDQSDKKRAKGKDDFQPYNYGDIDFSRFQARNPKQHSNINELNKKQQGRRTPWLGGNKKNVKKPIGGLKK